MSKRLMLGTILAGAAVVTTAGPVAAATPERPSGAALRVAPAAGIAGSTVTVTGTECLFDGEPGMGKALIGGGAIPIDPTPAGPDGTWTASAQVPAGVAAGRLEVTGMCGNAQGSWEYAPTHYFVTDISTPQVKVSATQVKPGTDLVVSGAGCTGAKVEVIDVFRGLSELNSTTVEPAGNGDWSVTLTVPTSAPLGSSPVGAYCYAADGTPTAFYAPATVAVVKEITAPKTDEAKTPTKGKGARPQAVKAKPRFTG